MSSFANGSILQSYATISLMNHERNVSGQHLQVIGSKTICIERKGFLKQHFSHVGRAVTISGKSKQCICS